MNPLTLAYVLSLFNPYINITSQSSLQHRYHFHHIIITIIIIIIIIIIIYNLYSLPPCGSTPVLPGYLLLRHSCTWDKTSTLWSCHTCNYQFKYLQNERIRNTNIIWYQTLFHTNENTDDLFITHRYTDRLCLSVYSSNDGNCSPSP